MSLAKLVAFLSWKGDISRATYAITGLLLFLVKWNIDRLFFSLDLGSAPSPFPYLLPTNAEAFSLSGENLYILFTSLPFIYIGIALTIKRLHSLNWPLYSSILFFIPFINLLFFCLLSILPKAEKGLNSKANKAWLDRIIPRRKVSCAALSASLNGILATLIIFISLSLGLGQDYGWGFFVGLPFTMGLASAVTYGHHEKRSVKGSLGVAILSVVFASLFLFLLAIEGIICLAMAAPIALPLSALGGWVGYLIQNRPQTPNPSLAIFLTTFLLMGFEEKSLPPSPLLSVRSEVIVNAPPEKVWNNVVTFSELPPADDWLFDLGIACPTCATIEGTGVGAIRYCNFTTGPFVEPITVWDEPNVLAFDVTKQPAPMKELSPYDIHPPHLDGHLQSKRGEFRLERIDGDRTRLTGTTWYKHNMWPAFYWKIWSDFLIGRIHDRVLQHVKNLSEES